MRSVGPSSAIHPTLRNRFPVGFFATRCIFHKRHIFSTFQCTDGLMHMPQTQTLFNSVNRYVYLVTS